MKVELITYHKESMYAVKIMDALNPVVRELHEELKEGDNIDTLLYTLSRMVPAYMYEQITGLRFSKDKFEELMNVIEKKRIDEWRKFGYSFYRDPDYVEPDKTKIGIEPSK